MRDGHEWVAAGRDTTPFGVPLSAPEGVEATVKLDATGTVPAWKAGAGIHRETGVGGIDRGGEGNLGRRGRRNGRLVRGDGPVALKTDHKCHNGGRGGGRSCQTDAARHVSDDLGAIAQMKVGEVLSRE